VLFWLGSTYGRYLPFHVRHVANQHYKETVPWHWPVSHCAAFKVMSTCPEFTVITYASTLKGLKMTPCTNVPVICELCIQPNNFKTIPAVWRYNLEAHIKSFHLGHMQFAQFSQKFLGLFTIDTTEQLAMGTPQEQIPPVMATLISHNVLWGAKHSAPDPPSFMTIHIVCCRTCSFSTALFVSPTTIFLFLVLLDYILDTLLGLYT